MEVPVNYLAIIVCAISNMIIGTIWYGPLFGKAWMKMTGVQMGGKNPTPSYIMGFVGALIAAYVLAHFVWLSAKGFGIELSMSSGVMTAFWGWLGFVVPATVGSTIWEGKPWSYWFITAGYWLISLIAMGAILGYWQ